MEAQSLNYLKIFYEELYNDLLFEKKLKKKSVLISMMEVKSNFRYRFLQNASISYYKIPEEYIRELINYGYIAESDELDKYFITGKGAWLIESDLLLNNEVFINYINEKFFNISLSDKSLTEKEKVILFSMICARTFSKDTSIDLKLDDDTLDAWKRIIDSCSKKLWEFGIVSELTEEKIYGKKGNEHIVSHLIRHTDSIPKKTKGIYIAPGQQKYYLDIWDGNKISNVNLTYTLTLIFNTKKQLSIEEIFDLKKFCSDIAYQEAPYLFDLSNQVFTSPEYDDIINNSIDEAIFLR